MCYFVVPTMTVCREALVVSGDPTTKVPSYDDDMLFSILMMLMLMLCLVVGG